MVAISQTEGLPHPISQPETPRRRGDIGRLLKKLTLEYDLDLPWNEYESPSKKRRSPGHDVARAVAFLYFQDRKALDRAVDDFRHWLPTLTAEGRLGYLLERPTIEKTNSLKSRTAGSAITPGSARRSPTNRHSTRSANLPEPTSPTLSIRNAPPTSSIEMPADDLRLPPPGAPRRASLKRPRSTQSLAERIRASASRPHQVLADEHMPSNQKDKAPVNPFAAMLPRTRPLPYVPHPGTTSANTSFTSNGLTSADTSFCWSQVEHGTQEPGSPATSVDESFHTREAKDAQYGWDGANDFDRSQTYYGSSPRLEDIAPLQMLPPEPRQVTDVRQSIQSQSEYGGANMSQTDFDELEAEAIRSEAQLPSPPNTDIQPQPHELTQSERVGRITEDGLSGIITPKSFLHLPLDVRWEAIRVLQHSGMGAGFGAAWPEPRTVCSLHELAHQRGIKFERGCETDFSEHGLAARLCWSSKSYGRVFDLQPHPPRKDNSNALERKFGRSWFLYIDVPALRRLPKELELKDAGRFAGRIWRQFLVQPKKPRRTSKAGDKGMLQITFFVVRSEEGAVDKLKEIPIAWVLDWAVQFSENARSPQCKIIEDNADHCVHRNELVYDYDDQMPTDEPDDIKFHDPTLPINTSKSSEPMSGGCCRISTWAMREIQRILGLDYLPSAVQGRVFGAKRVWYCADDGANLERKPEKLIWISKSQMKVRQKEKEYFDTHKVTFNVVRVSRPAYSSYLYADLLPILVDRGVPRSAIEGVVKDSTRAIADEFHTALPGRMGLGEWVTRQSRVRDSRARHSGIDAVGGFPVSREEKVLQMLAAGFEPKECKYVADEARGCFEQYLDWYRADFKTQLRNSTMLLGIADPLGVPKPGKIHVGFSKPFQDSGQSRYNLRDIEALVTRLPALGASDVQRVRCVFHERLSHLHNVVVFPSRGPRSLASKLQGGDSDGDTFVIIWEPSLVKHFLNAPVPRTESSPEHFGIEVDQQEMGSLVLEYFAGNSREHEVLNWININTEKRMQVDLLGQITLLYEKTIYHDNSLVTSRARETLRLHDLMIDAAKQGYTLPSDAWDGFKSFHGLDKVNRMPDPAHRQFSKGSKQFRKDKKSVNSKKTQNISDYVYFEVVEPELEAALVRTKALVGGAKAADQDLGTVFHDMLRFLANGSPAHSELHKLREQINGLKARWATKTDAYFRPENTKSWRTVVEEVRKDFESIMPGDASSEIVKMWLYRTGSDPTLWEKLRASCLEVQWASAKLMFCAAGYEMCFIKAHARGYAAPMRKDAYCHHQLRRWKRALEDDADDEEADANDLGGLAELG